MSRMAIPTMDVVRFKEDDVIVASGIEHKYATLFKWGVDTEGDAGIHYSNGHSFDHFLKYFLEAQGTGELDENVVFYKSETKSVTLGALVSGKDADGEYSDFNGKYETFNGGKSWYWCTKQ